MSRKKNHKYYADAQKFLKWIEENGKADDEKWKRLYENVQKGVRNRKQIKLTDEDIRLLREIKSEKIYDEMYYFFDKHLGERMSAEFYELNIWFLHDFFEKLDKLEATGEAEIIQSNIYGFLTKTAACDSKNSLPANVFLGKIENKYIVWIDDELTDGCSCEYVEYIDMFDKREEAEEKYKSLIRQGIPSFEEQEKVCLDQMKKEIAENVQIIPRISICDDVDYNLYYNNLLLIEHMKKIDSHQIEKAVMKYQNFCNEKNIELCEIKKEHPWGTNQKYYYVEYFDQENNKYHQIKVHIPSKMQHKQREVIDLIEKYMDNEKK